MVTVAEQHGVLRLPEVPAGVGDEAARCVLTLAAARSAARAKPRKSPPTRCSVAPRSLHRRDSSLSPARGPIFPSLVPITGTYSV